MLAIQHKKTENITSWAWYGELHSADLVDELVALVQHGGVLDRGVHCDALIAPAAGISNREPDIRGFHLWQERFPTVREKGGGREGGDGSLTEYGKGVSIEMKNYHEPLGKTRHLFSGMRVAFFGTQHKTVAVGFLETARNTHSDCSGTAAVRHEPQQTTTSLRYSQAWQQGSSIFVATLFAPVERQQLHRAVETLKC